MLENSLADVAGEEQRVRPVGRYRSEKSQFGYAEILSLIDDDMIERLGRALGIEVSGLGEDAGAGLEALGLEFGSEPRRRPATAAHVGGPQADSFAPCAVRRV